MTGMDEKFMGKDAEHIRTKKERAARDALFLLLSRRTMKEAVVVGTVKGRDIMIRLLMLPV